MLRDPRVTSVVVGASSDQQLEDHVAAIDRTGSAPEELTAVDAVAIDDPAIALWRTQSMIGVATGAPHAVR